MSLPLLFGGRDFYLYRKEFFEWLNIKVSDLFVIQ